MMNENQIVNEALETLRQRTGLNGTWRPFNGELDGEVDFYFQNGNQVFMAEVKTELRRYQLPTILDKANQYHPLLVIANTIFPTLKEELRARNIAYLDTAGNIFIKTQDNYIWIDGNKKPATERKQITNRAFTKTGLKTVFYILLDKDAINMPYRQLADRTDVALGNIKNIMEGLKEAGFILQVNEKTMKLQNKKALLERWIAGYRETLKPAIFAGAYNFWKKEKFNTWQAQPIHYGETTWGGEAGGELLTNYLRAAKLTVYTNERPKLIRDWTLIPHDPQDADIYIYKKFWKDDRNILGNTAPPLLIYADLLLTDDPRCIETAERIYKKYLADEFDRN